MKGPRIPETGENCWAEAGLVATTTSITSVHGMYARMDKEEGTCFGITSNVVRPLCFFGCDVVRNLFHAEILEIVFLKV